MNLAQRLKAARQHASLTQKELAQKAGVEQPLISQIERGINLKSAHIGKLAKACGADPYWLETGYGQMLPELTSSELEPVHQLGLIKRYPVINEVQAGEWAEICEQFPFDDTVEWQATTADAGPHGFWLRVKNDSMTSPSGKSFPEGMLILVHPGLEVMPGQFTVAKLDSSNKATFKKFIQDASGHYLKPLNPSYRMIPINGDCRFVGRVIEAKWADL